MLSDWILICVSALIAVFHTAPSTAQLNEGCAVDQGRRTCYTLYGSQSDAYTWNEAFESCQIKSSDLVSIEDEQTQNGLVGLTEVTRGGNGQIWIAGRRSEDRAWRYVNGDPADGYSFNDPCGYLDMSGSGGALDGFVCYSTSHIEHSLCQYSVSQGTCEALGDISYGGQCYRTLERRGGLDWNSARQDCRSMVSGAELAYSDLDQFALTQIIQESIGLGVKRKIWVGLTSRKWVWKKQGTDEIPMVYTKFRGGVNLDRFVYFDAGDSGKWGGKDDPAVTSSYYICKSVQVLATTTTTTPAPKITTPSTTVAPTPSPTTPAPTEAPAAQTITTAAQTTTMESTSALIGDTTQATGDTTTQKDSGASGGRPGSLTENHKVAVGVVVGLLAVSVAVVITVFITRHKCPGSPRQEENRLSDRTYVNTSLQADHGKNESAAEGGLPVTASEYESIEQRGVMGTAATDYEDTASLADSRPIEVPLDEGQHETYANNDIDRDMDGYVTTAATEVDYERLGPPNQYEPLRL